MYAIVQDTRSLLFIRTAGAKYTQPPTITTPRTSMADQEPRDFKLLHIEHQNTVRNVRSVSISASQNLACLRRQIATAYGIEGNDRGSIRLFTVSWTRICLSQLLKSASDNCLE